MKPFKYPRTYHFPWSLGRGKDDKVLPNCQSFEGAPVVVTEKMDGENTSLYRDGLHARTLTMSPHPARTWIKAFHAQVQTLIPEGWRICGENLYAKHTLKYEQLQHYFYLLSVWNEQNICLSWEDSLEWSNRLKIPTPRVLYEGIWDEKLIKAIKIDPQLIEGYVVRIATPFSYEDFSSSVAKWVRKDHVSNNTHWMHQPVTPNHLKRGSHELDQ